MKRIAALATFVLLIPLSGCEGARESLRERSRASRPPLDKRCQKADDGVLAAISQQITAERFELLRNGFVVGSNEVEGVSFVSVELVEEREADDPGRILTFATDGQPDGGSRFEAVEEDARKFSSFPRVDKAVNNTTDGVIISRGCVSHERPA